MKKDMFEDLFKAQSYMARQLSGMAEEEKEDKKKYKYSYVDFIRMIFGAIWCGTVITILWNWFIQPLGVLYITIPHGIGIDILVSFIVSKPADVDYEPKHPENQFRNWSNTLFIPLVVLVGGFIAHLFI